MGDFGAIADAGETIVGLLRDRMADLVDEGRIELASPVDDDLKGNVRLTVFLYDVDGVPRPTDGQQPAPSGGTRSEEPLRLELKYLLTAHPGGGNGSATASAKTVEEQRVLGRAMQVLGDNAIVEEPDLHGSLGTGGETLRLSLLPEATDTVVNLWNTFQGEAFRPSAAYLATPIEIESRRETPSERVEEARFEGHVRVGESDG